MPGTSRPPPQTVTAASPPIPSVCVQLVCFGRNNPEHSLETIVATFLQPSLILWRPLIGSDTRACCTNLLNVGSRRPAWRGSETTYPTDTSPYKLTAVNLFRSPFQLGCRKDLTSALYSLWCSLMTYHLTPNRLQLNFMLITPSYINCIPDAKNFLSYHFRMPSRQQKTGHCHGMDDSAAQKHKCWLHSKIFLLNIKLSTSRMRR